jgi:hypothetical protein
VQAYSSGIVFASIPQVRSRVVIYWKTPFKSSGNVAVRYMYQKRSAVHYKKGYLERNRIDDCLHIVHNDVLD